MPSIHSPRLYLNTSGSPLAIAQLWVPLPACHALEPELLASMLSRPSHPCIHGPRTQLAMPLHETRLQKAQAYVECQRNAQASEKMWTSSIREHLVATKREFVATG